MWALIEALAARYAPEGGGDRPALDRAYAVAMQKVAERLADDPDVRVFACYVEGFRARDGRRFLDATRRITGQGRAVILYRAGRSPARIARTAATIVRVAYICAACQRL